MLDSTLSETEKQSSKIGQPSVSPFLYDNPPPSLPSDKHSFFESITLFLLNLLTEEVENAERPIGISKLSPVSGKIEHPTSATPFYSQHSVLSHDFRFIQLNQKM